MAYDEGLATVLREDLAEHLDIREQKMFGGICFMKAGHMLCGIHKGGAMFRVGKDRLATGMAIEGAKPMTMTGRTMRGFIDVAAAQLSDDWKRRQWLALALENIASLPPK